MLEPWRHVHLHRHVWCRRLHSSIIAIDASQSGEAFEGGQCPLRHVIQNILYKQNLVNIVQYLQHYLFFPEAGAYFKTLPAITSKLLLCCLYLNEHSSKCSSERKGIDGKQILYATFLVIYFNEIQIQSFPPPQSKGSLWFFFLSASRDMYFDKNCTFLAYFGT